MHDSDSEPKTPSTSPKGEGDGAILRAIRASDFALAVRLAEQSYTSLLGQFFMALLGDRSRAKSLVSQAIESACGNFGAAGAPDISFRAYLLAQAKRLAALESLPNTDGSLQGRSLDVAASQARSQLADLLPSARELLVFRYVCKLTTSDLSEVLGVDKEEANRRIVAAILELCAEKHPEVARLIQSESRGELRSHWPSLVDGSAPKEVHRQVAEDDDARDALHLMKRLLSKIAGAGSDYVASATGDAPSETKEIPTGSSEAKVDPAQLQQAPRGDGFVPEVVPFPKRLIWLLTAIAILSGGLILSVYFGRRSERNSVESNSQLGVASVLSVSLDSAEGRVSLCDGAARHCRNAESGTPLAAGELLQTNESASAMVAAGNLGQLQLGRDTVIHRKSGTARLALERGTLIAEIRDSKGTEGLLDVKGWSLVASRAEVAIRAESTLSVVQVNRGTVRLVHPGKAAVVIYAGEQALLEADRSPLVSAAGDALLFARGDVQRMLIAEDDVVQGLGEVRARKPGESTERADAVRLARHRVKVHVVGAVARTEIEEVFANNTNDVLEGTFRFPLPSSAQIERLALDVDGQLQEGAFVERDRAAAIWRGNIVNAAPQMKNLIKEDIVWVPGPWRDPALLEWQRGNRFELKIYPIPKKGQRRIVLAYTEVLPEVLGKRRYTYSLPTQSDNTRTIEDFAFQFELRGHDSRVAPTVSGYRAAPTLGGEKAELRMEERNFVARGDLSVEFALPNRGQALLAWAYQSAQAAEAPYVAMLVHPKLPSGKDVRQRDYAFVVDVSRSMYGENLRRARQVVVHMMGGLMPGDRATLLACHSECDVWSERLTEVNNSVLERAQNWLEHLTAEGASDPAFAVESAIAQGVSTGRRLEVVYVGDGAPTVGAVRPSAMTTTVRRVIDGRDIQVTAVAIGAEFDLPSLRALTLGGRGVVVPYVPGANMARVAARTMSSIWGAKLTDLAIETPPGMVLSEYPGESIFAGEEVLLAARLDAQNVRGDLVLRGKVRGEPFEQRYPMELVAQAGDRNAFVPRLFAKVRISTLDGRGDAVARQEAVALSKRFSIASRHTSLLVLESQAMFQAFGLDNQRQAELWSGELDSEGNRADSGEHEPDGANGESEDMNAIPSIGSGGARMAPSGAAPAPMAAKARSEGSESKRESGGRYAAPPGVSGAPPRAIAADENTGDGCAAGDLGCSMRRHARGLPERPSVPIQRPRMIPMRRIWERRGEIVAGAQVPMRATAQRIAKAAAALAAEPLRRSLTKQLFDLQVAAGNYEEAEQILQRWSERDPLDVEAMIGRADLAAHLGQRAVAIRILGSVVDIRPSDVGAQQRLARLYRWLGNDATACRFSVALAAFRAKDLNANTDALRCSAALSLSKPAMAELRHDLLSGIDTSLRDSVERAAAKPHKSEELLGDLRLNAIWSNGAVDLDLALLDPDGHRISWLGAPSRSIISAAKVSQLSEEALALRGGKPGEYVIEIVAVAPQNALVEPVRGTLEVVAAGTKKTLPFVISGTSVRIGLVRISTVAKLVPLHPDVAWRMN